MPSDLLDLFAEIDRFVATYDEERRRGNHQRSPCDAHIGRLDELLKRAGFNETERQGIQTRRDALDALRRDAPEVGRSTTFG